MELLSSNIPVLKRKGVHFEIRRDLSGGVRIVWNKETILLSPDDARAVIIGIADALDIELASFPSN